MDGSMMSRGLRRAAFECRRLGLFVSSVAINLAATEPPPPWVDRNAYYLALSGAFFAGVTWVTASVLTAAAVAKLREAASEVAQGGRLGLLVASTAITLAVLGDKHPSGLDKTACFLALSGAFFAGVAQVAASVVSAGDGRPRP